jgi:hypothetical protein
VERSGSRSSLSIDSLAKLAWPAFGALVAINAVWLVVTLRSPPPPLRTEEAYGECRAAIRRVRPEAARIQFPTADLIRVTRRDSVHHVVRGYYVAPAATFNTNYTCELSVVAGSTAFRVDTIVFPP